MSRNVTNDLLNELGKTINIKDLALNEFDVLEFMLEDKVGVFINYEAELNSLVLNFVLGHIAETKEANDLMYEMLCGNYMWEISASGHLAIDKESDLACLNKLYMLPTEINENEIYEFIQLFSSLYGAASYWADKIQNIALTEKEENFDRNTMISV